MRRPRIGLALSGGGFRGLGHLGILQALEEEKIPVDYIAGTSMGGIVAALYAAGIPMETLVRRVCEIKFLNLIAPDLQHRGFLSHEKVKLLLISLLGREDLTFADLNIPLAVVACDLESSEMVVLNEGPLLPALLSTAALPFAFSPIYHQGRWLVDGGPLNNLPVDVVRTMGADRVLAIDTPTKLEFPAVNLIPTPPKRPTSIFSFLHRPREWLHPFLIGEQATGIAVGATVKARLAAWPPDLLLEICIPNMHLFDTDHIAATIQCGRQTALNSIEALRELRDRPLPPLWMLKLQEVCYRLSRAWDILIDPNAHLPGLPHPSPDEPLK